MKYGPTSIRMLQLYMLATLFFTANSILTVIFPLQAADGGMLEGEIGIMMGFYIYMYDFTAMGRANGC
ncbi:hypothetical protein [Alkalihalobacillus sp. 1P02AB]|uniref:hypothetical protein n=1 Tax=Alkalihalobacillus sp. 1P02AB TaxID=3132260 RepID=UPI0039A45D4A